MEILCKIERKLDERSGESNGKVWKYASFLAEQQDQNKRKIQFDVQENEEGRIGEFERAIGRVVYVNFGIEARMSNNRWFNTIKGWRIKELN